MASDRFDGQRRTGRSVHVTNALAYTNGNLDYEGVKGCDPRGVLFDRGSCVVDVSIAPDIFGSQYVLKRGDQ